MKLNDLAGLISAEGGVTAKAREPAPCADEHVLRQFLRPLRISAHAKTQRVHPPDVLAVERLERASLAAARSIHQ